MNRVFLYLEVFARWIFYVCIVSFSLILLTALQVRQQIKAFDDFKEYSEYANHDAKLEQLKEELSDKYFRAQTDQANWNYFKQEQQKTLEDAVKTIEKSARYNNLSLADVDVAIQVDGSDPPELRSAVLTRKEALNNLVITAKQMDQVNRSILLLKAQLDSLQKRIDELDGKARRLLYGFDKASQIDLEKASIPADRRAFTSLASYLDLPLVGRLVSSPADFLVMLLAMLMGAVGGILSVARSVVDPNIEPPSRAEYFLRPIFGFIIALVGPSSPWTKIAPLLPSSR